MLNIHFLYRIYLWHLSMLLLLGVHFALVFLHDSHDRRSLGIVCGSLRPLPKSSCIEGDVVADSEVLMIVRNVNGVSQRSERLKRGHSPKISHSLWCVKESSEFRSNVCVSRFRMTDETCLGAKKFPIGCAVPSLYSRDLICLVLLG
jgi:hypothetical protein